MLAHVTLAVDDCWRDHTRAFRRAFESKAIRGVFYPIAGLVGKNFEGLAVADWDELKEISKVGHEIGSHSMTHPAVKSGMLERARRYSHVVRNDSPFQTVGRLRHAAGRHPKPIEVDHLTDEEEVRNSKEWIEERIQRPCESFAYPGGGFSKHFKQLTMSAGYNSARTAYPGYNVIGKTDQYRLEAQVWDWTVSAAIANSWVDKAIRSNSWLIELFHAVDLEGYPWSCSGTDLADHLDYLSSRERELEVLCISEAVHEYQPHIRQTRSA